MVNKVTLGLVHAMIACLGLSVCAFLYIDLVSYNPPLTYLPGSDVFPNRVHAGDNIEVTRKFVVKRTEVIRVSRSLVKGDCKTSCVAYDLEPSISTVPVGTFVRTRTHLIPHYVVPGQYRLEFYISWENFLGRTYSMQLPHLEIEVIK